MPVEFTFTFDTAGMTRLGKEAAGRALARVADDGANLCKTLVRVDTSTLQLSCHSADLDYDGSRDFIRPVGKQPMIQDLQTDGQLDPSHSDDGFAFGSWVPYAEEQNDMDDWLMAAADEVVPLFPDYFQEEMNTTP